MKKKLAREFRGFETTDDIRENLFYEKVIDDCEFERQQFIEQYEWQNLVTDDNKEDFIKGKTNTIHYYEKQEDSPYIKQINIVLDLIDWKE